MKIIVKSHHIMGSLDFEKNKPKKDILAISAGVREKMDRQYLEDTRSLKNVGNCFRSARNLYDKVLLVEKV